MEHACAGVDQLGQCLHVGAEQFLQGTVCQYLAHDGVLGTEGFEHLFARGVLSAFCLLCLVAQFQFVKEHLAHLSR